MPDATIVVCTHDRGSLIERAVRGALAEAATADADVLVVDNASTDDTGARLRALATPRLRTTVEPRLGLSAARNRGLAEARSEVAVFLDDDALPRPGWLRALLAPYAEATVACVGGPIRVALPPSPPSWLPVDLHPALGAYDLGPVARRIRHRPGDEYPYGGNISFRVRDAVDAGGFSERIGLQGRRQLAHEETDLCYRLDRSDREIRYAPDAVVDHLVLPDRLAPAWFLERFRRLGESSALFELRNRGVHRALGRLRWYYAAHLMHAPYRPGAAVDPRRLVDECRRQEAVGFVLGLVRSLPRFRRLRREAAIA